MTHFRPNILQTDAILMASGLSVRFGGENKLLLPFKGLPLALYTLRLACAMPQLYNVFFVCSDKKVAALADGLFSCAGRSVTVLHNSLPHSGRRESVRLGAQASTAGGMLFFTCDQPLLDAATINAVLAKARPGAIVTPQYRGKPGSPVYFSCEYRAELMSLAKGEAPRSVRNRHLENAVFATASTAAALMDIDTPDDFKRLLLTAR